MNDLSLFPPSIRECTLVGGIIQLQCVFLWFMVFFSTRGQEWSLESFLVVFFNLAGMTALVDDSLKILCQNYDKFGFWMIETRN